MSAAVEVVPMSSLAVFLWGSLGGLLAYFVLFALPELLRSYYRDGVPDFQAFKLVLVLAIAVVFVGLGGGAALLLGDVTEVKQAVAYGLAGEGLLAGGLKGIVDSVKPKG